MRAIQFAGGLSSTSVRRLAFAFAVALSLAVPSAKPANAGDAWEPEGGPGDHIEEVRCPKGEYLIGLYGKTGLWIDQIGLSCGRFTRPSYNLSSMQRLPPRGGNGGGSNFQDCDINAAIRSIELFVIADRNAHLERYVSSIRFHCLRPVDGSNAGDRVFGGTYKTGDGFVLGGPSWWVHHTPPQDCTGDQYATGLTIRYGQYVNAIGLLCDSFETAPLAPMAGSVHPSRIDPSSKPNPGATGDEGDRDARTPVDEGQIATHQPAYQLDGSMSDATDRPGSDYTSYRKRASPDGPARCRQACVDQAPRCKAWTYVRAGFQGPTSVCFLKDAVPPAVRNDCCISGALSSSVPPEWRRRP